MIDALIAVGLLLALVSLTYTVGALLLHRISGWTGALEKAVFAVPVGMGVVSYVVMAFGLLRLFRPPLFYGILGLGVVVIPFAIRDLLRSRKPASDAPRSRLVLIVGIVLVLLGICVLIAALAPPTEWDALSYHLAGPKTYLRNGRIFYIPYDHHTNFPFLLQMLYTLMLGTDNAGWVGIGAAKLCHTLCGVLTIASLYTFATRHIPGVRGQRVAALAAIILASTPMILWEMTIAYSDLATTMYTWLAVYGVINFVRSRSLTPLPPLSQAKEGESETPPLVSIPTKNQTTPAPNALTPDSPLSLAREGQGVSDLVIAGRSLWLPLSAVLIGCALATKFTVLAYWGLLVVGILAYPYLKTRRIPPTALRQTLLWITISLLVAAPWYIKSFLYTGNPTYPFLYGLFGGRYWSAANAAKYALDQSQLGGEKSPVGLLTAPWMVTMFPAMDAKRLFTEYYTFSLSPVYLGLLMALPLLGKRLSRPVVIAGLFGLGVTAFWFGSVQQTRYLLPALPAFALVCAEGVVLLWESRQRFERWAAAGLVVFSVAWGIYIAGGMAFWGVEIYTGHQAASPAIGVVTGQQSREDYLQHSALRGIAPAEFWINENTPSDAKVAMFDLERGFYLNRDYLWAQPDHAYGLIPWDSYRDADDWLADFKRRGYTTLLIGARDPSMPDDNERWRTLLDEAVRGDKVTSVFEVPAMRGKDGNPIYVRVYRIP